MFLILAGCASPSADTGGGGGKGKGKGKGGGGAVPVEVASATRRDVPIEVQAVGTVEAYTTISVKSQVGGQLTDIYVREGEYVKKGSKLFSIDARPYEAQLAQAEANKKRSEALLNQAQANLAKDEANYNYQ